MPWSCTECGTEFYSETELREHQWTHIFEKLLEGQRITADRLGGALDFLSSVIRFQTIIRMMESKNITFDQATGEYLAMGDKFNEMLRRKLVQDDVKSEGNQCNG